MIARPDPATARALARYYDLDVGDEPDDLDLYRALADRADGPILELAAGTGRLAVPLASAGYEVTAVDVDPAMLERARQRAAAASLPEGRLGLVEADLLTMASPERPRHALAFIALNSIMLLEGRAAQRAALGVLAAHLRPGGLAVVDAWLPDAEDLARYDGRTYLEWVREESPGGPLVIKHGSAAHDAASGTITLTSVFEVAAQGVAAARWIRQDRLRLVSADDLAAFAEDAGLRVELLAGGYDLGPLGPGAERVVLIAERPVRTRRGPGSRT